LKHRVSIVLIGLVLAASNLAFAIEDELRAERQKGSKFPYRRGDMELAISVGYAWGFQVGRPNAQLEDVEILSFAPRWGIAVGDQWAPGRWYETRAQVFLEGTFLWETRPKSGSALGAALMLRFNALALRASTGLVPFFSIGAGIVALDFDLIDQDDGLNFTPQMGIGLRYMLTEGASLELEWRYYHISNAGSHLPNHGINTNMLLLGTSIFF
jgi:opacity protein-like surface antigen